MVKKTISITIEMETYLNILSLKSTGKEINISKICDEALKSVANYKEQDKKPSDELTKELETKRNELLILQARLSSAMEQEKKDYDEQIDKAKRMQIALRNARVLDFD